MSYHISQQIQRAIALYDFTAQEEAELSFRKGEELELLEEPRDDWTECRIGQRRGLIPMPYVRLLDE